MKVKLPLYLFLLIAEISFSQTEIEIYGKVLDFNTPVKGVEVINRTKKISTTTNAAGEFQIKAQLHDSLYFFFNEYEMKRIKISHKDISNNNLVVTLQIKPEELNEVTITKMPSLKLSKDKKWEQAKLNQYALEKAALTPKVNGVYTGNIENGPDLIKIGGMIIGLFLKEKENKKSPEIDFATFAKNTVPPTFFSNNLKLGSDYVELFIQFCESDPEAAEVVKTNNILRTLDFLYIKKEAFEKLKSDVKL